MCDVASGTVGSDWSVAETVYYPAALNVTLTVTSPANSEVGEGSDAPVSDDVRSTILVTVTSVFQVASHARTVTVNGIPTVCATGIPVLPVGVPGAADSPGNST